MSVPEVRRRYLPGKLISGAANLTWVSSFYLFILEAAGKGYPYRDEENYEKRR